MLSTMQRTRSYLLLLYKTYTLTRTLHSHRTNCNWEVSVRGNTMSQTGPCLFPSPSACVLGYTGHRMWRVGWQYLVRGIALSSQSGYVILLLLLIFTETMFNYSKFTRRFISPPNRMFAWQTTSSTCMIYTYSRSLCGRVCTRFLCFSTIPRGNNIITTKIQNDYNTTDTFFNSS